MTISRNSHVKYPSWEYEFNIKDPDGNLPNDKF